MTELDREINTKIMNEIGLDIGPHDRIIDQDTGEFISINGMKMVAPGCASNSYGRDKTIEFDPHNNRKLMGNLFGYFLNKLSDEGENSVLAYYAENTPDGECVECRMSDNSTITSKSYKRDSLKYTDAIIQLNGGDCGDELKKYDTVPTKTAIKKKK